MGNLELGAYHLEVALTNYKLLINERITYISVLEQLSQTYLELNNRHQAIEHQTEMISILKEAKAPFVALFKAMHELEKNYRAVGEHEKANLIAQESITAVGEGIGDAVIRSCTPQ